MKPLTPLPLPSMPYFDAIVDAKEEPRHARLVALKPTVGNCFQAYYQNRQQLHTVAATGLTDEAKDDLRNCYTGDTVPLHQLKRDIIAHQDPASAALCQYCGLNAAPRSFDHYLPKEAFAEFSTLSLNLVPCCLDCNQLKREAWLQNGQRMIVSFYYDTLPITQYLHASITLVAGVPEARFALSGNAALYGGLQATVQSHFEKLDLLNRYAKAWPAVLSENRQWIHDIVQNAGVAQAGTMLTQRATELAQAWSLNFWKVALYQAMAASQPFLQFC
jgi:hypothetical protein